MTTYIINFYYYCNSVLRFFGMGRYSYPGAAQFLGHSFNYVLQPLMCNDRTCVQLLTHSRMLAIAEFLTFYNKIQHNIRLIKADRSTLE